MVARARAPKPEEVEEPIKVEVVDVLEVEEPLVQNKIVKLTYDGRVYDVEVREINGRQIVQESVYKEVNLPYSKRTTKILVAAAGTQVK